MKKMSVKQNKLQTGLPVQCSFDHETKVPFRMRLQIARLWHWPMPEIKTKSSQTVILIIYYSQFIVIYYYQAYRECT